MPYSSVPTSPSRLSRSCRLLATVGLQESWLETKPSLLQTVAQLLSLPWGLSWRRLARWSGTDSCRCMFPTSLVAQQRAAFRFCARKEFYLSKICCLSVVVVRREHCPCVELHTLFCESRSIKIKNIFFHRPGSKKFCIVSPCEQYLIARINCLFSSCIDHILKGWSDGVFAANLFLEDSILS